MFYEFLCKARIIILTFFFNENISQIDVFAHNVRNITYFCKYKFNNYIFNILYIVLLCNFFCNISSFLCLILWSFSVKSVYSRLLRRVFMLSLIHIFSCRYFLWIISYSLFIILSAWSRQFCSSFSLFRFWCLKTYSWFLFYILLFWISRVIRSSSRQRFWFKSYWISIFSYFLWRLFWRSLTF